MRGRILIVDDEQDTALVLAELLQRHGFITEAAADGDDCLERLTSFAADVVVTDVMMPRMSGLELCAKLRAFHPQVLPIVLTARNGVETAVEALRAGAFDYITKPVAITALEVAIGRALAHVELQRELARLRTAAIEHEPGRIVGRSDALQRAIALAEQVAATDATVIVTGESGTGKEMFARMLHDRSPRRDEPFVAINCAAMPAPLLESELFGHVRGAFTDARQTRPGLFVRAGGGTVFLDELGEMPLEMQVKLLRVLQERTVRAVGSDHEVPVAARVVASTNRDLERAVAEKRFRKDLYYRINVVAVPVPPLRARGADVLLLAHYFVQRAAKRCGKPVVGVTAGAALALARYAWPGNVRELENCIDRAVALCRLDQITLDDLPAALHEKVPTTVASDDEGTLITLADLQKRYCREVLVKSGGNKSRAARVLGIDRRSLYRRLDREDL